MSDVTLTTLTRLCNRADRGFVPGLLLVPPEGHPTTTPRRTYTAGSDGHVMLAVEGDLGPPPATAEQRDVGRSLEDRMGDYLARPGATVDLAALRAWAGEWHECERCGGKLRVVCPKCDGKAYREVTCDYGFDHEIECEECIGIGSVWCRCDDTPDDGYGWIASVRLARWKLAMLLALAPADAGTVRVVDHQGMLLIEGDGWLGMVAGCAGGDPSKETRFEVGGTDAEG